MSKSNWILNVYTICSQLDKKNFPLSLSNGGEPLFIGGEKIEFEFGGESKNFFKTRFGLEKSYRLW